MRITTKLIITKIKLSQISLIKNLTIQAKQTVLIKNGSFWITLLDKYSISTFANFAEN